MKLEKKAQGISINTIIIAAIALIVLIILIAVFAGRMGWWGHDLDDSLAGQLCKGDMKMFPGNKCTDTTYKNQIYANFKNCGEGDGPDQGCYKPGYVCCSSK